MEDNLPDEERMTQAPAPGDVPVAAFEEVDTDQIPATDIVFECPYCGKSLSIDQRGAGLVIACTACQQMVTVPIPEGMELSDIDLPPEEQETQLSNMRVMLAQAQTKIAKLTEENMELHSRSDSLEREESARERRFAELRSITHALAKSLGESTDALDRLRKLLDEA